MIVQATQLPTSDETAQELDPRSVRVSPLRAIWMQSATLVAGVDIVLIAVFTFFSPHQIFWSLANAESLLRNGSEILLLAMGVTLLMSAGIFDLSVGANLVLASVLSALAMQALGALGVDPVVSSVIGLLICLVAGALFGALNGLIITKLKVNSLIATLGTLGVGAGVAQLLTNGQDVRNLPDQLQSGFALVKLGFLPLPTLCALLAVVGVLALLRFTRFGMRTLAIGSNVTAATRAGVNVHMHIVKLAALAGAFAGFAAFVDLGRFGSTAISSHALDGLNAVTAVVIGGTALNGGRASVVGALWGAALSVILLSGLIIIRVQPFWQLVATGIVLILAVAFDQFRTRSVERG
jgi:ribose transport system permease protein